MIPPVREIFLGILARRRSVAVEAIDLDLPIVALGLDSLGVSEVLHELETATGLVYDLAEALDAESLRELCEGMDQEWQRSGAQSSPSPSPILDAGDFPLSQGQRALYYLQQLDPRSTAYHLETAAWIEGPISTAALERALGELCRRHSALRTTFPSREDPPLQRVGAVGSVDFRAEDGSAAPSARLLERAEGEIHLPFDLDRGPLLRARLWTRGESSLLLLVVHHLVADLGSLAVLWRELAVLCAGSEEERRHLLDGLAVPFLHHSDRELWWLKSAEAEAQQELWRQRLETLQEPLALPTDRPRPVLQSFRGKSLRRRLPATSLAAVRRVAEQTGCTQFVPLLAAWQVVLGRWSGQRRFPLGSLASGRSRADTQGMVGYLVNPFVIATDLRRGEEFRGLVERLQPVVLEALAQVRLPFPRLVASLRRELDPSRSPLFQVLFALQGALGEGGERISSFLIGDHGTPTDLGPWRVRPAAVERRGAQFDLSLLAAPESGGGLGIRLEYCSDLFDGATAHRLLDHLQHFLERVTVSGQVMDEISLLSDGERHQLVVEAADTEARSSGMGLPTAGSWLREAARKHPLKVAVRWRGGSLTYRELMERSALLAKALRKAGAGPESIVALSLERGPEMVISVVACLRCGAAFLPLDPGEPLARRRRALEKAAPIVVLRGEDFPATEAPAAQKKVGEGVWESMHPENLAYVLFTSGSTGQPKGVMNRHGALLNRLLWMQETYGLGAGDRVLQKTPSTFDVSVWELLWPLMTGAELVLAPPEAHRDPEVLIQLIRRHGITVVHFVPSLLRELLREPAVARLSSLRLLVCSGEELTADLAKAVFEVLGQTVRLENLYGPTEAAIDVSAWRCLPGSQARPALGRPIANLSLRVLDDHLRLVLPGARGELCLGGAGLGRGYLREPARTAASFVPDPFDRHGAGSRLYRTGDRASQAPGGPFHFHGRLDRQVKLRGMRLELGEIENALRRHPQVTDAVAIVHLGVQAGETEGPGQDAGEQAGAGGLRRFAGGLTRDQRLVAYFEAATPLPSVDALRAFLAEELPTSLLPAILMGLDCLPRTASGKVDRRGLPEPEGLRPSLRAAFVRPQDDREKAICSSWSMVLGIAPIGIDDGFFHLGGDSIRSLQVRAELQRRGWQVSVAQMQRFVTPRTLAPVLEVAPDQVAPDQVALDQVVLDQSASPEKGVLSRAFSLLPREDLPRLPATAEDAYPLSRTQSAVIFHAQHEPGTAMYRDIFAVRCRGSWRPEILRKSLRDSVDRHPMLRSSFHLSRYSQPLQVVHQEVIAALEIRDLRGEPGASSAKVDTWLEEEKGRPLAWREPPPVRFFLLRLEDEVFALALSFFDAVLDGWSAASLAEEVLSSFSARLRGEVQRLPPLVASFRDFIQSEQEALASESSRDFWRQRLTTLGPSSLPRWLAAEGPDATRIARLEISPTRLRDFEILAEAAEAPLKTVFLAAHLLVLDRLQGSLGAVTGVESSGRPEIEDGDRVLGMHVNILPFALEPGRESVTEWVRRVHGEEQAMAEHRRFPFSEMSRFRSRDSEIETVFNYTRFHILAQLGSLGVPAILGATVFNRTSFALRVDVSIHPAVGHAELTLGADLRRIGVAQLAALALAYRGALDFLGSSPSRQVRELDFLSPGQRHQIVTEWNDPPGRKPPAVLLHDGFEARARWAPLAPAGEFQGAQLSYGELDARASGLAARLAAAGVGPEGVVAVAVERSFDLLVAVLGVLKAGAAFLPLNGRDPRPRQQMVLETADPQALVTAHWPGGRPTFDGPVIDLEARWAVAAPVGREARRPSSTGLAYLLFTSGSTGRPKGVVVSHRAAANFLQALQEVLQAQAPFRLLALTPLSFDISVLELFWTWHCGGTVVLAGEDEGYDGFALIRTLQRKPVNWMQATPTTWRMLIASGWEGQEELKILCGGEELTAPLAGQLKERGEEVWNLYGPTETTVWSSAHRLDGDGRPGVPGQPIPIGRPIGNTQCYVLDAKLRPLPIGTEGELMIAGAGLARGYRREPSLTAAAFLPNPFASDPGARMYRTGDRVSQRPGGKMVFQGRVDEQLKIRGHRIEPAEIAGKLELHSGVSQAVVVATQVAPDHRGLVAYLVAEAGQTIRPNELRAWLSSRLPIPMVPSLFVEVASIPRTSHGKVDRRQLPAPRELRPSGQKIGSLLDQLEALSDEEVEQMLDVHVPSGN